MKVDQLYTQNPLKNKYTSILFFVIAAPFLFTLSATSQENKKADSLLIYIKRITSSNDSANIYGAYRQLRAADATTLLNQDVADAIARLETKLSEKDYFDFASSFFTRLMGINTPEVNDYSIKWGKAFVEKYAEKKSAYAHSVYFVILRNLRVPYRNSAHIYEGIEYFGTINKKFLAAKDSSGLSLVNNVLATFYSRLGLTDKSAYYMLKSVDYLDEKQPGKGNMPADALFGKSGKVNRYSVLGSYYVNENKPEKAEFYLNEAVRRYFELDSPMFFNDAPFLFLQIARCKTLLKSDSSQYYYQQALHYFDMYDSPPGVVGYYYQERGADFLGKNMLDSAAFYVSKSKAIKDSLQLHISSIYGELVPYYYTAQILVKQGKPAPAITLLQSEITELKQNNVRKRLVEDLLLISQAYQLSGKNNEAYQNLNEAFLLNKKITDDENEARSVSYEIERKMLENENTINQLDAQNEANKKVQYYLTGIVSLLGLLAISLGVFYAGKRKSNRQLASKNDELAKMLSQLKETQSKLIHSEKMASLGELTAGIAHEIQNPLNFVNNFSDINTELIGEQLESLIAGDIDDAIDIANNIKDNERKINHHGKRADSIVKGMLQHSRNSNGLKEFTDINKLADEYMRLSYQGLRAKDKSFNTDIQTAFADNVGSINIIPQDIGRVLLNLFNNAFYALNQKQKKEAENGRAFKPTVTVSTKRTEKTVEITVADNGSGIPQKVVDKIFQPFFTTKPTGEGTGLGLSLSYDIIKAHGGEIKVESSEAEGTTFIIELPVN